MKVGIIGSFVVDLMARAPHLPEPGETVKGSLFKMGPGGKGFNQAIAAHRAGSELVFSTKLGKDDFSAIALDTLKADGLSSEYVFTSPEAPTGIALISVDENSSQNEIIVVPGACNTYNAADVARLEAMVSGCAYLLLQLEINLDALEMAVDMAERLGVRVILNPAPVISLPEGLYKKLYMVTPNEVEARILTGVPCDDPEGCARAAAVFFDRGVRRVIITLGSRGVYVHDGEREWNFANYPVKILDTTGAGDAFNGGLLAALGKGMKLEEAAEYGNVTANLSVTKLGTTPSMPREKEIGAFVQERHIKSLFPWVLGQKLHVDP
jgi:ribokinase